MSHLYSRNRVLSVCVFLFGFWFLVRGVLFIFVPLCVLIVCYAEGWCLNFCSIWCKWCCLVNESISSKAEKISLYHRQYRPSNKGNKKASEKSFGNLVSVLHGIAVVLWLIDLFAPFSHLCMTFMRHESISGNQISSFHLIALRVTETGTASERVEEMARAFAGHKTIIDCLVTFRWRPVK